MVGPSRDPDHAWTAPGDLRPGRSRRRPVDSPHAARGERPSRSCADLTWHLPRGPSAHQCSLCNDGSRHVHPLAQLPTPFDCAIPHAFLVLAVAVAVARRRRVGRPCVVGPDHEAGHGSAAGMLPDRAGLVGGEVTAWISRRPTGPVTSLRSGDPPRFDGCDLPTSCARAGLRALEGYGCLVRERLRRPDGALGEIVYSITGCPASVDASFADAAWTFAVTSARDS